MKDGLLLARVLSQGPLSSFRARFVRAEFSRGIARFHCSADFSLEISPLEKMERGRSLTTSLTYYF